MGHLAPEALEWLFTLAAIVFLTWQAAPFREPGFSNGAGERYRNAVELKVATAKDDFDPAAFETLVKAHESIAQSLARPIKARLARLDELENRAREARAEVDVQGAIEGLAEETRQYRDAYGLGAEGARSIPLECAWDHLEAKYLAPGAAREATRVRALAVMAALLGGDSSRASALAASADARNEGWSKAQRSAGCAGLGSPPVVIAAAAEIVAKARASEANAAKSTAARELISNAHWYFALWAAAGLALLQVGRWGVRARRFVPLAAMVWAALGWITHVHVEWLNDRSAQTAWLVSRGIQSPQFFQFALATAFVLLLLGIMISPRSGAPAPPRQTPSSRIGYAGFVLFVGLGWWLTLDLSATGHYANRFHALYQQVYVFGAFVLLTTLAPMRLRIADTLGRSFGLLLLLARRPGLTRLLPWAAYAAASGAVLAAAAAAHGHQTQLTSEVLRLWLVLGVSWFFFVRGDAVLALAAGGVSGALRGPAFVWPLLLVLCVPVLGLMLTDDFGPLFVMLYAASIFLGAGFAFAFFDRAGYRGWLGGAVGILVAGGWLYLLTFALYSLPAPLARIAERLESVRSPFTATNDQLAVITWFQESAPTEGYGLGAVPWCGEIATGCRGVPRQIQSDYVYTALVGVYGKACAIALVALLAFWLVELVIHHGRATRGTVALESAAATQQAWLSWIAVCWVGLTLAQLAITVCGNLGWLPLTGITFPFASFGAWSLLANTFFLSLAIGLPRKG